jgi:hypothetical protein
MNYAAAFSPFDYTTVGFRNILLNHFGEFPLVFRFV